MKKNFIWPVVLIFFLLSCGSSWDKEELTKQIKKDMIKEAEKSSLEQGMNIKVKDLVLVEKEDNKYDGLLTTIEDGVEITYDVDVTTDGDSYIWKIND